jgi:hypothetical protein
LTVKFATTAIFLQQWQKIKKGTEKIAGTVTHLWAFSN